MTVLKDFQSHVRRSGTPATIAMIVALVVLFLFAWMIGGNWVPVLGFNPQVFLRQPWSVVTYPFAVHGRDIIGLLLTGLVLYWFGGSVERELGTPRYLAFFAAMTLLPVLFLSLGGALMGRSVELVGMHLPLAGVIVAWATRNPTATILLMFVIPVQARIIGWITAALVFFGFGFGVPLLGVFAVGHLALAYAFAANKLKFLPWSRAVFQNPMQRSKQQKARDDRYFEEVRQREQEREERERLRKLFESSFGDDEPQNR